MALTSSFLIQIQESLSSNGFVSQDFHISYSESSPVSLMISYRYNDQFYFSTSIGGTIDITFNPGTIVREESYYEKNRYDLFQLLQSWLKNINLELKSSPTARKLTEHDEIIRDFQTRITDIENGDEQFSSEEGNYLKEKLDDLEQKFSEKLESDKRDKSSYQIELRKLSEEIGSLKMQLDVFTKKNWFLSLSTKLFLWSKRNPETVRQLAGAGRDLLPEEVRDAVSDDTLDLLLLPPEDGNAS
jgi:hypothetical protein